MDIKVSQRLSSSALNNTQAISGLKFRRYQGEEDIPRILSVTKSSAEVDGVEYGGDSVETVARQYEHMVNCDPSQDIFLVEVDDQLIGYGRCFWGRESGSEGVYLYDFVRSLLPDWRHQGIGEAMLELFENRLREVAATHPSKTPKFFQNYVEENEIYWIGLLENADYKPIRYEHSMLRLTDEEIPDLSLSPGLEIRPVLPEHYRTIWESDSEAFQDSWGFVQPTEADYQYWISDELNFQPHLWQVAWDTNTGKIAGQVQVSINAPVNAKYGSQQGFIGPLSIRYPWRRQGNARALLANALRLLKEQGIKAALLNVDTENKNGATQLYESCGFWTIKRNSTYRKALSL